ncbi:MAG: Mrp/NBP35 family ATP-binding protein [Planctomycetota bacterium]
MAFEKEQVLAAVQERLAQISPRGTPGDVIKLGLVQRIIAHEGQVTVVLSIPPDLGASLESLSGSIERSLSQIDGVAKVQVLETRREARKEAPEGAPASPVGAQQIPGVRHTLAIASGKGGVGKSTIAVNLAAQLTSAGQRVGLLDADVYGPSVPKMLGLEGSRPQVTEDQQIVPIEKYGMRTMSIGFLLEDDSPVIWRGPMVAGLLRQFLYQVTWGELDYLVLDLPPGTGDAQLTLVQSIALSGGVIVTTPQDVALLDVQRGIQMFSRVEVPILGVIENMSLFECPHCGERTEIFSSGGGRAAAQRYRVPFLGSIPLDAGYVDACDRGVPTVVSDPESSLAQALRSVADEIVQQLDG